MSFRSATEQIADLNSGKTSSLELVDAAIDQIQKADETSTPLWSGISIERVTRPRPRTKGARPEPISRFSACR